MPCARGLFSWCIAQAAGLPGGPGSPVAVAKAVWRGPEQNQAPSVSPGPHWLPGSTGRSRKNASKSHVCPRGPLLYPSTLCHQTPNCFLAFVLQAGCPLPQAKAPL